MLSWPSEFLGSGRKLPPDAGFLHPKWLGRRLLSWCHISLVHLAWPCYKPSGHAQMDWRSALTWLPGPTGQNSQFHCAFQELLKPFHHGSAPCKAQALRQHRFVQGQRSSLQLNRVMWWLSAFRCSPPNGNLGFHLDIRVEPCIWMVSKVLTHLQATKCHPLSETNTDGFRLWISVTEESDQEFGQNLLGFGCWDDQRWRLPQAAAFSWGDTTGWKMTNVLDGFIGAVKDGAMVRVLFPNVLEDLLPLHCHLTSKAKTEQPDSIPLRRGK